MNKKAISAAPIASGVTIVIVLVILSLVAATSANVLTDMRSDMTADAYDYNITSDGLDGLDNLSDQQDTMGTVTGAVIIITLIVSGFAAFQFER